jgi:2-deoxy-D-gluconate 3-dehydrogenase
MNLFDLTGKVALVTGASRGLGAGIAAGLAAAGAEVAIHASEKLPTATEAAIVDNGGRARGFVADLSDRHAADALLGAVLASFGRVDILVNNAGICPRKPAADHDDEIWDRVIEVNLTSVFRLSRAVGAPSARARRRRQDHQCGVAAVVSGRHHLCPATQRPKAASAS